MEDEWEILGGKTSFKNINWHSDFKTDYIWEKGQFYIDYDQELLGKNCDVKVPREISRFHELLKVALAYYYTKNLNYKNFVTGLLKNWISENPLMFSINWGCTMDVAIRAVNLIWIIRLLEEHGNLSAYERRLFYRSLYEHGWFIYRNPEKADYNNHNHYLADLSGQIYLGIIFKSIGESDKWLKTGVKELFHEIRLQILPSGMIYERSTSYNRLVLELILFPILLLKSNGMEIPADIWFRLEMMFSFIMYSTKPDGTTPLVGDQDNGRLLPFGNENLNNYRYLLSLGALLFNNPDFKKYSSGYNIYCKLFGGTNAKKKFESLADSIQSLGTVAFKDVGLYILRSNDNYMMLNLTGKGLYSELSSGTHTHSDLLSFELYTNGKTFLVDPGSYVYTADIKQRKLFRSTEMHNTVTIDELSQNNIDEYKPWDFERNAIPKLIHWESNDEFDKIIASHSGYERLSEPVLHTRTVTFDKKKLSWEIIDSLTGKGTHKIDWYFHFDIGIDFVIEKNIIRTICKDNKNIEIVFCGIDSLVLSKINSFVSKSYGAKSASKSLRASIYSKVPVFIKILIKKK